MKAGAFPTRMQSDENVLRQSLFFDFMLKRIRRFNEALAVIQSDFPEVLYPADDAIRAGLESSRCDVMLLLYNEGEENPLEEIWVEVFTPQGILDAWSIFLTPPLAGEAPPVFTLEDMEFARTQPEGYVDARMYEWDISGDEGVGQILSILVNAPTNYLDADTVYYALDEALSRIDPVLASRYTLTWEHDVLPAYGRVLLAHMRLSLQAYEAANREEYLRARARADKFWIENVLPLKTHIDATRIVEIPSYILDGERAAERREDQQLLAEDQKGQFSSIVPIESLLRTYDPDSDPISREIANSPRIQELVHELIPWEAKYPELKVQEALKWIERHRTIDDVPHKRARELKP